MGFRKKAVTADNTLYVRVTPADEREIRSRAERSCMSVSEYIRRSSLGRRVDTRYDVDAILALREVVSALRALHADPRMTLPDEDVRTALQSAVSAMDRV